MKLKPFWLTLVAIVFVLIVMPVLFMCLSPFFRTLSQNENSAILLTAPPFVSVAQAEGEARAGTDFLSQQAGIAAYTNAGVSISIPSVRPLFRGVERVTDDYIIGSIKAPAYVDAPYDEEEVDPHAYIHKDGWIVAYYLKDTPAVHIVSWPKYEEDKLNRNNLSDVISTTLKTLGVQNFVVDYYDFRFPNADSLIIMTDGENTNGQSDSFTFKIPSSVTVYERSWEFAAYGFESETSCTLNNKVLHTGTRCEGCWGIKQGSLTDIQLRQDVTHTVMISHYTAFTGQARTYCAIGLVYKETP